jgi:SAM-dependent methyltransferase
VSVFGEYAQWYDLLYRDKDYAAEVGYVAALLRRHGLTQGRLLELGCGTGVHASGLVRCGFEVVGIDRSPSMLAQAERRRAGLPAAEAARLAFAPGDARAVRLPGRFDAVLALFHVMSYQRTGADLDAAMATAAAHLAPGGLFLFDCWHGPAVRAERPEVRTKRVEDDAVVLERLATPRVLAEEPVVEVAYDLTVTDKRTGAATKLREVHSMRYLFPDEIHSALSRSGHALLAAEEWLTGDPPGPATWSVCYVGRRAAPAQAAS